MKLFQLLESSLDISERIQQDCQPFLSNSNVNLVRGLSLNRGTLISSTDVDIDGEIYSADLYEFTVRTDRKPRSTGKAVSKQIDDWFDENYSVRPRSSGVFTSPLNDMGLNNASYYGSIALIFPIGDYTAVYSEKYEDLFIELNRSDDIHPKFGVTDPDVLAKFLTAGEYQVGKTITLNPRGSKCEVVIVCQKYYALVARDEDGDIIFDDRAEAVFAKLSPLK